VERDEFYAAQVGAAVYATGYRAPKYPVSIADLMPSVQGRKHGARNRDHGRVPRNRSQEEIAQELRQVLALWNPRILNPQGAKRQ